MVLLTTTAFAGKGYIINTSNEYTINLNSPIGTGDTVAIKDSTFGTNNVTVGRNSSNIQWFNC